MFGRRLCLSYEMKKEKEKGRKTEKKKKKTKKEGENLRPPRAFLPSL